MSNKTILFFTLLLTFFVFSPTLSTYFSQDDWVFLSHVYKQPFTNIFRYYPEAFYRPIGQHLFFWIGTILFGLDSSGFHLLGVLVHLVNVILLWKLLRNKNFLLLLFYAINPAHFVALNWLTQVDIEIAVSFALVSTHLLRSDLDGRQGRTLLDCIKKAGAIILFLFGVLSHEVVVFLPVVWLLWFRQKKVAIVGLTAGLALLGAKFLTNPFSPQGDYRISLSLPEIISVVKWYGFRALSIPEGIRNFPVWLAAMSLVPAVVLILTFRQKLVRGLGVYLLGVLPVLGFGSHLFAAYALFGIALMVIELSSSRANGASREIQGSDLDRPSAGGARFLGFARNDTIYLLMFALILSSMILVYFNVPKHWSTGRGLVSARLANSYIGADSGEKKEIITASADFATNPEIYFSSMMGRQFEVLDRGVGRGLFDVLFYRGNDMTTQFFPDAKFFKDSLLARKFPMWNSWAMAGMPYFLDPQNFLWYPPNYILLLLPLELGFLILLIGHVVFAGYFLKKLLTKFPAWIQWCGILLYLLSPKLVSHLEEGNWTLLIAVAWLPPLYYALREKKFWLLVISLSALIINNLNVGYYAVLFVFSYFIFLNLKRFDLEYSRSNLKALFCVAFFTLPRWLPLLIWGRSTVRANLMEAPIPFWSWTKIVKSFLFPLAEGHPFLQNEEILYVGIIPILILVVSICKGLTLSAQGQTLRSLFRSFWLLWIGFIVVVALNIKTPLFFFVEKLPGFSLLRITTRPWIFVSFFVAIFAPTILSYLSKKSKILGITVALAVVVEFGVFGYGIFARRVIPKDPLPTRFYQEISRSGVPVRAYCTTGCLDRLTAQNMGIALLGGNNPIQLTEFVHYLEKAGGYRESAYHPILPPYTVFSSEPQPNATVLGQTATKFVISPYQLTDNRFELRDAANGYFLYENKAPLSELKEYYFAL